ncbi:hypothetical protein ACNSOO_04680 [Aliarcobacter lanthieri]|uniref:hypothetical protein n=1 Tax=Aliarcobacter lanthieri TaxID=1355374 RepID=UPI003AAC47D9
MDVENIIDGTQPTNQENQETQNQNTFDEEAFQSGITRDEAKLSLMQEEFSQIENSLNDEFEIILKNNPTAVFSQEEIEALASDSDIASKNKLLRDGFEKFKEEKLSNKKSEITKFEELLNGKRDEFDLNSQSIKFAKKHPNVNMEEFAEFIQEDLTIRQRKELLGASKSKYDFLIAAHEIYSKAKGEKTEEDDELPPDLSQANGATGNNSFSKEEDEKEYLKSIGIGRE